MIKSSCKNGITVEKDIELVMKNTGSTPWHYYMLQFLFLSILSCSIAFCFLSGLGISVENGMVMLILAVFVVLFMALFSFRSILKYTGLVTLFLYVMFGYINLERLQEGSAQLYNCFIEKYNDYFNESCAKVIVNHSEYGHTELFFVLFTMVLIVAVVCYTAMYGRTMFFYLLTTVPVVFLCFIVGYMPEMWSYMIYISGTLALFASVISERYGLFSKVNRRKTGSLTIMVLERTRVKLQMICAVLLLALICIIHTVYSPERYQKEFDADKVRIDLQDKLRSLTSGELLKDTFFDKIAHITEKTGNSGLSNGRLGTIGKITYANKTALIVRTDMNKKEGLYLKGYVGERYEGDRWTTLSKADQRKVRKLDDSLNTVSDVEMLSSQFSSMYDGSIYRYYPLSTYNMEIENKSADASCEYVPYASMMGYNLENGKVKTGNSTYQFYRYDINGFESGLTYDEMFYKYFKFNSVLQLNTLNTRLINKELGYELTADSMEQAISEIDREGYPQTDDELCEYDNSISIEESQLAQVFRLDDLDVDMTLNNIVNMNDYAADENAYFNLVKDIYTKLPDSGLEKVKDLVKDKKVKLSAVDTNHSAYYTMDQVDTTAYVRKLYEIFGFDATVNKELLLSSSFTYDEKTKQDRIFDAISYVKDYLAQNTSYTLSPGKTPSGEDYVEYFLFNNKKGYCMHYASAATVMLRAMGVPARYCEGYVVTEEDLAKAKKVGAESEEYMDSGFFDGSGYLEVDVKDTNAHAWVEVYLPGYGWAPVEMTAPYSSDGRLEIPPVNQNPKATLKPTLRPTPSAVASNKPTPKATNNATDSPKVTSSPNQSMQQAEKDTSLIEKITSWHNGLSNSVKRLFRAIIGTIFVIFIACAAIWLRRKMLLMLHKKRLDTFSTNQIILYEYSLLSKHTAKKLPPYTTATAYEAYAQRFVDAYPFMERQDAAVYFAILLKAKFSMTEMTKEEQEKVIEFNKQFIMHKYENASKLRQWYYKYIVVIR